MVHKTTVLFTRCGMDNLNVSLMTLMTQCRYRRRALGVACCIVIRRMPSPSLGQANGVLTRDGDTTQSNPVDHGSRAGLFGTHC